MKAGGTEGEGEMERMVENMKDRMKNMESRLKENIAGIDHQQNSKESTPIAMGENSKFEFKTADAHRNGSTITKERSFGAMDKLNLDAKNFSFQPGIENKPDWHSRGPKDPIKTTALDLSKLDTHGLLSTKLQSAFKPNERREPLKPVSSQQSSLMKGASHHELSPYLLSKNPEREGSVKSQASVSAGNNMERQARLQDIEQKIALIKQENMKGLDRFSVQNKQFVPKTPPPMPRGTLPRRISLSNGLALGEQFKRSNMVATAPSQEYNSLQSRHYHLERTPDINIDEVMRATAVKSRGIGSTMHNPHVHNSHNHHTSTHLSSNHHSVDYRSKPTTTTTAVGTTPPPHRSSNHAVGRSHSKHNTAVIDYIDHPSGHHNTVIKARNKDGDLNTSLKPSYSNNNAYHSTGHNTNPQRAHHNMTTAFPSGLISMHPGHSQGHTVSHAQHGGGHHQPPPAPSKMDRLYCEFLKNKAFWEGMKEQRIGRRGQVSRGNREGREGREDRDRR